MSITAGMVKELRERTGSGMMECKKALQEADGDMELAIENMRKAGLAKADKKSGRIAAEGSIGVKISGDEKTAAPERAFFPTASSVQNISSRSGALARDNNNIK